MLHSQHAERGDGEAGKVGVVQDKKAWEVKNSTTAQGQFCIKVARSALHGLEIEAEMRVCQKASMLPSGLLQHAPVCMANVL